MLAIAANQSPGGVTMSDRTFRRLSSFIHEQCGIKIGPSKKVMLEGRIRKRMRVLGITSTEAYCDFLFSPRGIAGELVFAIDAVTTNKTDFFREPGHFDLLVRHALPELARSRGAGFRRKLRVWSAGCSTGEEPYTLAIVLSEFAEQNSGFGFSILATDICTRVLDTASTGIYDHARIEPIAMPLRRKYLLRHRDKNRQLVRMAPELRALVQFRRLNLIESDYGIAEPMEVVFCRNVIIYFDRQTQEGILRRLCDHLVPGGFLFMGHSETLNRMDLPLAHLGTTVYRKL